jgi:hypothetical protein
VGDNDHGATLELRLQQVHHIVPRSQGRWARSTWRQVRSKETASTIRSARWPPKHFAAYTDRLIVSRFECVSHVV